MDLGCAPSPILWTLLDGRFVNLSHASLSWELVGLVDHSHACKKCINVQKSHVYKVVLNLEERFFI